MAEYMIQSTTLTAIADAVRAKDGSTGDIPVSELANRISAIPTGVTVQSKSGTFTTNNSGSATVNCGFRPDVVVITKNETSVSGDKTYTYAVAIPFLDFSDKNLSIPMWTVGSNGIVYDFSPSRTTNGFTIYAYIYDENWEESTVKNTSFTYTAYKFTE